MEHPQPVENKEVNSSREQVRLRTTCRKRGLDISDEQSHSLGEFVRLLVEWNAKINLISRKDVENVWQNHILHSLSPLFKIDLPGNSSVLDLGTGGGLPGIPWKIVLPTIQVTMIDATQKKINAVRAILNELRLSKISAVWGRAEDLGRTTQLRGKFDYVVARGVGPLDELAKLARPFLKHGQTETKPGKKKQTPRRPALLAFKGGDIESEVIRAERVGGVESIEIIPLNIEEPGQTELTDKKLVIAAFDNSKEPT